MTPIKTRSNYQDSPLFELTHKGKLREVSKSNTSHITEVASQAIPKTANESEEIHTTVQRRKRKNPSPAENRAVEGLVSLFSQPPKEKSNVIQAKVLKTGKNTIAKPLTAPILDKMAEEQITAQTPKDNKAEYDLVFKQVEELVEQKKYDQAIISCDKLIKLAPTGLEKNMAYMKLYVIKHVANNPTNLTAAQDTGNLLIPMLMRSFSH